MADGLPCAAGLLKERRALPNSRRRRRRFSHGGLLLAHSLVRSLARLVAPFFSPSAAAQPSPASLGYRIVEASVRERERAAGSFTMIGGLVEGGGEGKEAAATDAAIVA